MLRGVQGDTAYLADPLAGRCGVGNFRLTIAPECGVPGADFLRMALRFHADTEEAVRYPGRRHLT